MVLPAKVIHPKGDTELSFKKREISALIADTFDGKIHIEWDPQAQVTPVERIRPDLPAAVREIPDNAASVLPNCYKWAGEPG